VAVGVLVDHLWMAYQEDTNQERPTPWWWCMSGLDAVADLLTGDSRRRRHLQRIVRDARHQLGQVKITVDELTHELKDPQ
jgi:hypothetical protein